MKKSISLSIIFTSLITASTAMAWQGLTPVCTKGPLNLVIISKGVSDCNTPQEDPTATYCFYHTYIQETPRGTRQCSDLVGGLWLNTTNSISYGGHPPTNVTIAYDIDHRIGSKWVYGPRLVFSYNNGSASDNCAQVLGSDVKCTISQSGDANHKTYTLTLSRNS